MMPLLIGNQRYSLGFFILVAVMVGIFSLVIGVLVLSLNPQWLRQVSWEEFTSLSGLLPGSADQHFQRGLELLSKGELEPALSRFSSPECKSAKCSSFKSELDFASANFDWPSYQPVLKQLAGEAGDSDAQFLLATMLSNRFSNVSEYTSKTLPESVLYLYAASTAAHPGALLAMGYRHLKGYGVPKRCETAALNYLEVAKPVANIYANSVPRAVELVRLGVEKDKKILTINEISLFTEVASTNHEIALAVGKRFLLGTDGFPQDYAMAEHYFAIAAGGSDETVASSAWALLGYISALGLGTEPNMARAEELFGKGESDALAKNGLGFIRFQQERFEEAFKFFNASAASGSGDGMFNLASVYLTGTGVGQNFQKAFMWYTEALKRGHTPAGYALAVMHLNGIGTVRDCWVAVSLLKEVAERGDFAATTLRVAHALLSHSGATQKELGALLLLKLAEAGHQVSQENLAHLIDSGVVGEKIFGLTDQVSRHTVAQRLYEMAAEQGSVAAELRLGDFAYYGFGLKAEFATDESGTVGIAHSVRDPDMSEAARRYRAVLAEAGKVAQVTSGGPSWLARVTGTAEFNLGFMHQFGLGMRKNSFEAARHYRRAIPKDSHGVWIWERLIDWFVHPREEAADSVTAEITSGSQETAAPRSWKKLIQENRVWILMGLGWLLLGLLFIRDRML